MMAGNENKKRGPQIVERVERTTYLMGFGIGQYVVEEHHGRELNCQDRQAGGQYGCGLAPDVLAWSQRRGME